MTRALILVHRWFGIAFCLLFAMWFSTGIVMHFVPFPGLTDAQRFAGLTPIDPRQVRYGPGEAAAASRITNVTRVRLLQRNDGPVYLVFGAAGSVALRAGDLTSAAVRSGQLALAIAIDNARRRGLDASRATFAELAPYDQWSGASSFDVHRPLYRIALNDEAGNELYVSSSTGEVVQNTTHRERLWNYAGSVAHWIYPTVLRSRPAVWHAAVWWLSLVALIGAMSGALLGTLRIRVKGFRPASPYRGWHAWHHVLGLISMTFVLTWILSGWLSMDNGRLFSRGQASATESMIVAGAPVWGSLPDAAQSIGPQISEVEWFAFNSQIYRRERMGIRSQRLTIANAPSDASAPVREFLGSDDFAPAASRLAPACTPPVAVDAKDDYAVASIMPDAPVYRVVCGDTWFHLDSANGALLEKLDSSRRTYRWLYNALHTFDVPSLMARPILRTILIVTLCAMGLAFSLTGVVIGWFRLRAEFRHVARRQSQPQRETNTL